MTQEYRRTSLILGLLLVIATGGDAPGQYAGWKFDGFPVPSPAVNTNGTPGGWYGGDSAYMTPLDANTVLWTFADVYVGAQPVPGARNRLGACTGIGVGNSIALVQRDPTTQAVTTTHYFRGSPTPDATGVFTRGPYPFFLPPGMAIRDSNKNNGDRLWPHKGLLIDGSLYIFTYLLNTENNHYTIRQTLILKIVNPHDPPSQWKIGYLSLGKDNGQQAPAYFGAEAFYVKSPDPKENYLYVYGIYCDDYHQFFTHFQVPGLRIPLDQLKAATDGTDLAPVTEVMAKKYGTWKPWPLDPNDFHEIGNSTNFAAQSYATKFNKTLNSWQVTFAYDRDIEATKFGKDDPKGRTVWVAKGAGPFGPWEKPILAYTFPEASVPTPTPGVPAPPAGQLPPDPIQVRGRQGGPVYYGKLYGYFAHEVPELETADDVLALTYSTDTTRVDIDRFWNLDVYTVKLVRPIPNPLLRPSPQPGSR